jgi:hypothetical protein
MHPQREHFELQDEMFSPGKDVREAFPLKTVDAHPAVAGHLRDASTCEGLQQFGRQKDRWPFHASGLRWATRTLKQAPPTLSAGFTFKELATSGESRDYAGT